MDKYIKFGKCVVKNSKTAKKLFFDSFYTGFVVTKYKWINYLTNNVLMCIFKTYFEVVSLLFLRITNQKENNKLIIKTKTGAFYGITSLSYLNNILVINKTFNDEKYFNSSKEYYDLYKKNESKINLPNHVFKTNSLTQVIDYLPHKTLSQLIRLGYLSYNDSLKIFSKIQKQITTLYKHNKNKILISGDLTTNNIYISNDNYFLIDYSESFSYFFYYDLYTLLRSVLSDFGILKYRCDDSLKTYICNLSSLLKCDDKMLEKVENMFFSKMKQKEKLNSHL
ncbi:MAG TPA: hypothetical protein PK639_01120 [Candidatus Woesebacteria bacterium]|nr:hypothetical protein [Candidatus Woesebacteria bacterium]